MANTALQRTAQVLLTNKSGGNLNQGDTVVVDLANAAAFTTTTTSGYVSSTPGVVLEPSGIANNAQGMVALEGPIPKINLSSSASLGDFFKTHTVAGQAVRHAAPATAGDFGQVLGAGTTPAAILWGSVNMSAGAGSDTNAIHVNAASEISGIAEKTAPVAADLLVIEDSAAANVKKKVQIGNLPIHAYVGCKAYSDSTQAMNNTSAAIALNQEEFDSDGFHDNATNNSRMTIPSGKDGKYLLQAGTFASGASDWIGFKVGGSTVVRGYQTTLASGGCYRSASAIVSLVAGNYVEFWASTSTSINFGHATLPDAQSWFAITLLGT